MKHSIPYSDFLKLCNKTILQMNGFFTCEDNALEQRAAYPD